MKISNENIRIKIKVIDNKEFGTGAVYNCENYKELINALENYMENNTSYIEYKEIINKNKEMER